MQKFFLVFPNTSMMAEFIIGNRISKAEVNSSDQTLSAPLTEDEIILACTQYGAEIKNNVRSLHVV